MMRSLLVASALALLFSASAAAEENVVKIGVLNDQTGPFADLAGEGSVIAAELAAEEFGGTVAGMPIEVIVGDHLNKPDVGAAIVRNWFDNEGVDVVTDVPSSSVALAVQEIVRERKKILLMSSAASSDLSNKACSPYGFQWTFDTYSMAKGAASAVVPGETDSWFFITADVAFGHALERDATRFVEEAGGEVLGAVHHPLNTADFSSFLLQAQASGAKVIGFTNSGSDVINAIKQAGEFGINQTQTLAALSFFDTDVHSLGLQAAQGLIMTGSFYWDLDEETRAWSKKFEARAGKPPTMVHAGVYSAVHHYLKAVEAVGSDDSDLVVAKMREMPVEDFYTKGAEVRADGRVIRDFYVMQVKSPEESHYDWDYFNILRVIPGEEMARPLSESECPLVTN